MMKRHCSSLFDRISELPCHITQNILMFLSLEDMVRTSILSRHWRLQWTEVPHLIFNRRKIYTVDKVFWILLQHQGPILKFRPFLEGWKNSSDIDKVISYLARNGIQDLELDVVYCEDEYVVPSSIFACVELKHLSLNSCVFKPLTFVGLNKLITLELLDVEINEMDSNVSISSCPFLESLTMGVLTHVEQFSVDAPILKVFSFRGSISNIGFMNTPLLKVLSFTGDEGGESAFDLMKLLCSLPLLEDLLLSYTFLKLLAVGVFSDKLPAVLNNLKKLELCCVTLYVESELSSTIWLLRNSPNLQKFKLGHYQSDKSKLEFTSILQVYSDFYLTKLQDVKVVLHGLGWPDVKFFKFLLAVSPELQKLCIDGSSSLLESEYNLVGELISYRRASRKAVIEFH